MRYLDADPGQAADLFPPLGQNLPEGGLFMKIRPLFPKQGETPMRLLAGGRKSI